MSKSARIDLSHGVNAKIDLAIAGDGYSRVMDGVDLRSGFPVPFTVPSFVQAVASGNENLWCYRGGKFHVSANERDYVGEFQDGKEVLYWAEEGEPPMMSVEGNEVTLAFPAPKAAPNVAKAASTSPTVTLKSTIYGNYANGRVISYRVAWEFESGIQPPSAKVIGTTTALS